jgi:uroporphyrinogen-III synthase
MKGRPRGGGPDEERLDDDGEAVTKRIALMRARDEAERSAALLRARGFLTALAPATEVRATGALPPPGPFDAVVATSAKAIALLAPAARERIAGAPLFVVGRRTARAARDAGMRIAGEPAPDVAALVAALLQRLAPRSRVLYLAGRDRRKALEAALNEAGHLTTTVEIYAAEARAAWSEAEARAIATCGAALHYSRRSAALAVALAERAGLADRFRALLHVCLSRDAGEPLRAFGAPRLAFASQPRENELIDALERALAASDGGAQGSGA